MIRSTAQPSGASCELRHWIEISIGAAHQAAGFRPAMSITSRPGVAVVWLESAAPAWAAELGHGRDAAGPVGMALLTLGLDSLARFYGLPE